MHHLKEAKNKLLILDLFGSNIQLLNQGKETFHTIYGALGSITIIIIFIVIFSQSVLDFVYSKNLSFQTSTSYNVDQGMQFSSSNFKFAVSITNYPISGNQIFNYQIQQFTRFTNGTINTSPIITLEQCKQSQWNSLGDNFSPNFFKSNNMSNYLCSPSKFGFKLAGQFGSPEFSYLKIGVSPCKQAQCEERVKQFVNKYRFVQFNIIYRNRDVDFNNAFQPFTQFPDRSFYRFVPYTSQLSIDQYIVKQNVITDTSILPVKNENVTQSFKVTKQVTTTNIPYESGRNQFFRYFFRIAPQKQIVNRKVQTLQEFLSFLGGVFSIIHVIGCFVLSPYAQFKFKLKLFNRQYILSQKVQATQYHKQQTISPSFPKFILYGMFGWSQYFIKLLENFINLKEYRICQEKSQECLDLCSLISTIHYLQNVADYLLEEDQRQFIQGLYYRRVGSKIEEDTDFGQQKQAFCSQQTIEKLVIKNNRNAKEERLLKLLNKTLGQQKNGLILNQEISFQQLKDNQQ